VWRSWVAVVSSAAAFWDAGSPWAKWYKGAFGHILSTASTVWQIWGITSLVVDSFRGTTLSACQCTCEALWCSRWAWNWPHLWLAIFGRIFAGAVITSQGVYSGFDKTSIQIRQSFHLLRWGQKLECAPFSVASRISMYEVDFRFAKWVYGIMPNGAPTATILGPLSWIVFWE